MGMADARPLASPPAKADFLQLRHEVGNVLLVLGTHAGLVAWFWLAYRVLPLALYVPLSLVACVIHQRAMSEWIHEAAHFNLLRTKRWNDLLGDVLAGVWFALPTASYRATHFQHHARDAFFLPGDRDTAFLLVGSRRELRHAVLRDVLGLTVATQYLRFRDSSGQTAATPRFLAVTAIAQATLLSTLWWLGRLDAWLLYYASLVTLYPLMNRVRTYGQHAELHGDACRLRGSTTSRTMDSGIVGRLLFASPRLLYHHEHHRWPNLPWRALPPLCRPDEDENRYARSYARLVARTYRALPERG
ncbi:MAG: fatty acid desaturase [Thermodesulfobacteriota bacterium]